MRQLFTLNKDGKLALRSANGSEAVVERRLSNILVLLDTSGSMTGDKLLQAKSGAVDFAHSASAKGYATALAIFGDRTVARFFQTVAYSYHGRDFVVPLVLSRSML